MGGIDLHAHTKESDGTLTPFELVQYALTKQLTHLAITDHDTTKGISEAISTVALLDPSASLQIIPGVELSCEYHGRDIHILGYYIQYTLPFLQERLDHFVDERNQRNDKMCQLLAEHGVLISMEELRAISGGGVITRSHFKDLLLKKGYVKSAKEAFERYIGDYAPCFVPRDKISPAQAICLIRQAGGVPVLAHPLLYKLGREELTKLILELKRAGLEGMECIYSSHTPSENDELCALATSMDLCITGGSDFHGAAKEGLDLGRGYGKLYVSADYLKPLVDRIPKRWIFTDMDGTLLRDDKTISDKTRLLIKQLSMEGHHIVLSSGRPFDSIANTREQLGLTFPGMFISAYNGALLYDCDQQSIIYETTVPLEHVRIIVEEATRLGLHYHTYQDAHILCTQRNPEIAYYTSTVTLEVAIVPDLIEALYKEPYKVLSICLEEDPDRTRLEELRQAVAKRTGSSLTSVYSNPHYLEFYSEHAGKGNALLHLCTLESVFPCDTIALGDEGNDISMILSAGVGVAMQNATEQLKEFADYVTSRNNHHDGFYEAVKLFTLHTPFGRSAEHDEYK